MALIHPATMRPTKLELLTEWLPSRGWHTGPTGDVTRVAAYRFDDPAGAVGIETILVQVGDGPVHQVPLTYRDAPLPGGDDWLITTSEHSVLGTRWIYDAVGDPVYVAVLASAIAGNTGQAEELTEVDGRLERLEHSMTLAVNRAGTAPVSGVRGVVQDDPTLIETDTATLAVARRLDAGAVLAGAVLTGTWPGQTTPVPLASATPHTA